MPRTVRYCIQCGQEIGDEPLCTNPDCGSIPNFYLHVPGPGPHYSKVAAPEAAPRRSVVPAAARPDVPTRSYEAQADDGPRRTMALQGAPIAILRAAQPPHEQQPVFPGKMEVGARSPAKMVIDQPDVSSRHACVLCRQNSKGEWEVGVVDRGSTNGTFVNDKRVTSSKLRERDRVRFATCEYVIRFLASEEPRVTVSL